MGDMDGTPAPAGWDEGPPEPDPQKVSCIHMPGCDCQARLAEAIEANRTLDKCWQEDIAKWKARLAEKEAELDKAWDAQARVAEIDEDLLAATNRAEAAEARLAGLKEDRDTLSEGMVVAGENVLRLNAELESVRARLAEKEKEAGRLAAHLALQELENERLRERISLALQDLDRGYEGAAMERLNVALHPRAVLSETEPLTWSCGEVVKPGETYEQHLETCLSETEELGR